VVQLSWALQADPPQLDSAASSADIVLDEELFDWLDVVGSAPISKLVWEFDGEELAGCG